MSVIKNNIAPVTVIIVNWNCAVFLNKCLKHLLNQSLLPARILVMDNGSHDDSIQNMLKHDLIEIKLLGSNLGFAAANNRAISISDTQYIALLNPDAFPRQDWLEKLIVAADSFAEIASFTSLQLFEDAPDKIDGAGDCYHISGLVWRDGYGAQLVNSNYKNKTIFSPCAAAALYRRQALLEIGGFDEDFFCYVEDVDLGFRLRLAGYSSMLVGNAVVQHLGSAVSGGSRSDFCIYHGHRNLVWAYIKNMPGFLFWLCLPLHLLLNFTTLVYFSFLGQGKVICRAKLDAVLQIPKMWRKRKIIQQSRVSSITDIWKVLNKRYFWF